MGCLLLVDIGPLCHMFHRYVHAHLHEIGGNNSLCFMRRPAARSRQNKRRTGKFPFFVMFKICVGPAKPESLNQRLNNNTVVSRESAHGRKS